MVIGLTGGIGSGKSTVANFFKKIDNVVVYDADSEAKKIMNSSAIIRRKILDEFGENSYKNNQLNKAHIIDIVFKDKNKLATLNSIVHPEVKKHFQNFEEQHQHKNYIVYENAILFESKSNFKCDFIITVYAPLNLRIERTILRDNSSKTAVEERINNQWLEDKKLLQSNYIIYNLKKEEILPQIIRIHNILTKKTFII